MSAIKYICDLCNKEYSRKGDLTRHKNRKTPCSIIPIEMPQIENEPVNNGNKNDIKELSKLLWSILDILRDNEGLTGEKAFRNMSYFLILKLLEPHFGKEIDIDNYNYDFTRIEDDQLFDHKTELLRIVRFSELAKGKQVDLAKSLRDLWEDILSKHPSTKGVFLEDKKFDIKADSTYQRIISKLDKYDLCSVNHDILGTVYEDVIKDIMTGKVLGQFFTPPNIKKMIIKLMDPQLHADGKIDTCCDPTMGTGGFLIQYMRHIKKQANDKNIKIDWEYIKNEGLYGKELEPDTYQLAVSNMLISSGHMFEKLEQGDSIRSPITRKFDIVLANPPFGIKGLEYDEFSYGIKQEYLPIKSNNAISLFIQTIIHILKINGKCGIVVPDGKDLFSKNNKTLVTIREYLLKTCDLKEVIHLPASVFSNTSIKTCIFYFIKKKEGTQVIDVKKKLSKTADKKSSYTYEFSKEHQTNTVGFYECKTIEDLEKQNKTLIIEVPIEKLAANSYSLNYTEYLEKVKEGINDNIVVKTLGDICEFLPKSKRPASYGQDQGKYPFFKSSMIVNKYTDVADYNKESIIIGDGGDPNINYSTIFSASDHCYILQNKDDINNIKYVYYYMYNNIHMLNELYTGMTIKNISKSKIENIQIPIPPLQCQQEIIEQLDFIEESNKTSSDKIEQLRKLNKAYLKTVNYGNDIVVKALVDICKFLPKSKRPASYGQDQGKYPFYTSSLICNKYCDTYDYEDTCLIIGTGGNANIKYNNGFSCSADNFILTITDNTIISKYIYYYLLINICILEKGFIGVSIKHISKEFIQNIQLPIPPIERQQEIIDYCENNDKLIKDLESSIRRDKEFAKQYLAMAINIKPTEN